jgi:membrane protease YdiL (CAAX protease family)
MSAESQVPPRPDALHPITPTPPRPDDDVIGPPRATWSWYEAVGVYVVAFLLAGLATLPVLAVMDEDADLTNMVVSVLAALVILGVLVGWLSVYHRGWPSVMRLPERGRWRSEISAGVLFGAALYPLAVFVVGGLVLVVLSALSDEPVRSPEQVPEQLSAVGIAVTTVYAIVIAPIGEEFFFRGVLFRSLRDRYGFAIGAIGSGIAFGLIHYIPGPAIDALLLMIVMVFTGAALAYIYERRGTIVAPMAAHVTFNVIGLALILGLR